jgi:diaminopimelate decarboxylase
LNRAAELDRLNEVASRMAKIAPISLRVNPDVDAKTHPYISTGLKQNKFGVAYTEASGFVSQGGRACQICA